MSSEDDYVYPGYGKSPEKFVFCEDVSKFYNKSDTIDIFTNYLLHKATPHPR